MITIIIMGCLAVSLIGYGVNSIRKNHIAGDKRLDEEITGGKYTEESVKKYCRIYGVAMILGGLIVVAGCIWEYLSDFPSDSVLYWVAPLIYVFIAVVVIIIGMTMKGRVLVSKED